MRICTTFASLAVLAAFVGLAACADETPPPQPPPALPPPGVTAASAAPAPADTPAPPAAPMPSMADMIASATKAEQDAIAARDAQKFGALFTTDGARHLMGTPPPDEVGRDAIVAAVQRTYQIFPDFKLAVSRMWTKDNVRITTEDWTGTDSGTGFRGAKPTGRPVGVTAVTIAVFGDDGLIKDMRIYADGATLMQQMDAKAKAGTFRPPPTLAMSFDTVAAGSPEEDSNLALAKSFYQSLDDKKEKDVVALASEDTTADDYAAPATMKGLKGWKGMYRQYVAAFPDVKQQPLDNQWAIGPYVVSEGVLKGTNKGAIGPFKASGKPVALHFVDILQFKAGKIARLQTWSNGAELLAQIGALPTPKPAQ